MEKMDLCNLITYKYIIKIITILLINKEYNLIYLRYILNYIL